MPRQPLLTRLRLRRAKHTARCKPLSVPGMRNALASGAIVSLRDSPVALADQRSTVAGVAILMAIALLSLILAASVTGWMRP